MSRTKDILSAWKKIYSNWRYSLALIIIAAFFYILNVFIQHGNYKTIIANYSSLGLAGTIQFSFNIILGFRESVYLRTFISTIILALLTGMLFTLIFYRTKALKDYGKKKRTGVIGTIGVFLGVAAPGCAACGVGLLALFGIGGAILGSLPLQGFEISLAAIGILAITVIYISKGLLECKTCQIQLNKNS